MSPFFSVVENVVRCLAERPWHIGTIRFLWLLQDVYVVFLQVKWLPSRRVVVPFFFLYDVQGRWWKRAKEESSRVGIRFCREIRTKCNVRRRPGWWLLAINTSPALSIFSFTRMVAYRLLQVNHVQARQRKTMFGGLFFFSSSYFNFFFPFYFIAPRWLSRIHPRSFLSTFFPLEKETYIGPSKRLPFYIARRRKEARNT